MLITAALPLLLIPFTYASVDQMETVKKIEEEKQAFAALTTLLANFQMGITPLSQLDSNQDHPFPEGTYRFKKLRNGELELWRVSLTLKEGRPFNFNFIVKRHAPLPET